MLFKYKLVGNMALIQMGESKPLKNLSLTSEFLLGLWLYRHQTVLEGTLQV
jgi:hypothetical protein